MPIKPNLRLLAVAPLAFALSLPAWAQDETVEEVVVTGSHIKQSPEDAPVPIDVVDSEELFSIGNPSVVELVKTLGVSSGVDGETNQFQSNGLEGTANINLRGLGAGRNLVLLNGRRNVFSTYPIAEQQQLFVDINMIPAVALDRVELLKDGAAATYGSDAISGVVNFITRNDFEGVEVAVSQKMIADSDGDTDFGVIWGQGFGGTHITAAFGYSMRSQLQIRDRDWTVSPVLDEGIFRSYSLSPNPGGFLDFHRYRAGPDDNVATTADNPDLIGIGASALRGRNEVGTGGEPYGYIDPFCGQIAGVRNAATVQAVAGGIFANRCTYNYTWFDNLIEEEQRQNLFLNFTQDFADTHSMNIEVLYGANEVPEWYTSPSYPPQVNFDPRPDTGRYIYADHPALAAFAAIDMDSEMAGVQNDFAQYVDANCTDTTDIQCRRLLFYGRPFGSSGPPTIGSREYEMTRFAIGFEGEFGTGAGYNLSVVQSNTTGTRTSYDVLSERWSESLRGYGVCGVADDGTPGGTKGTGDCEYYNPFSNAIRVSDQKYAVYTESNPNPNYPNDTNNLNATPGAGIVNSDRLREWLFSGAGTEVEQSLTVLDGVLTGEADNGVGWAFGMQWRYSERTVTPFDLSDLNKNPCQTERENIEFRTSDRTYNPDSTNCAGAHETFGDDENTAVDESLDDYTGSGPYYFLGGTTPYEGEQTVTSVFGELAVPSTDNIDLQISARYEDYGGRVGDTFDPKIAIRWQVTDQVVIRGSASSTFRGPTMNQLSGRQTTLSFVGSVGVYKAIDTFGNPDLDPESAESVNMGVLYDWRGFTAGLDYWSFDFDNPIIVENFNAIIGNAFSGAGGTFNPGARFADRITCGGGCATKGAADLERVRVNIVNGPAIQTEGFDFNLGYNVEFGPNRFGAEFQWTHIRAYDVGAVGTSAAFSALGKVNNNVSYLRPIVPDKSKLSVKYSVFGNSFNIVANMASEYVGSYGASGTEFTTEAFTTYDFHYNLSWGLFSDALEGSALWLSIYNLEDKDPPLTPLDLNYDPYTHNPFGQIVKVGVRYKY